MSARTILWRRLDVPGHEACRFWHDAEGWNLAGTAVALEGGVVSDLSYHIVHDTQWVTRSVRVSGWVGTQAIDLKIVRNPRAGWRVNGDLIAHLGGCLDLDLGFSPATNTSAIRRLRLAVGQAAQMTAAWLDTADWQVKPLVQTYTRDAEDGYDYGSPTHGYGARLSVNDQGLVTDYPDLWRAES